MCCDWILLITSLLTVRKVTRCLYRSVLCLDHCISDPWLVLSGISFTHHADCCHRQWEVPGTCACMGCKLSYYRFYCLFTGYNPVNMLDPICIWSGLAQKRWPKAVLTILAHWLASRLDPFAKTWHSQPVPNQIWAVLFNMIGAVCGRTQPSLKVGNW